MKPFHFSALLLASSASASSLPPAHPPVAVSSATKIAVLFSKNTSFAQLVAIRQDGIELEYQALKFDKSGSLLKISFRVDCRDGFAGSATSTSLTAENSFGFYHDYTRNAAKPFQIGNLQSSY